MIDSFPRYVKTPPLLRRTHEIAVNANAKTPRRQGRRRKPLRNSFSLFSWRLGVLAFTSFREEFLRCRSTRGRHDHPTYSTTSVSPTNRGARRRRNRFDHHPHAGAERRADRRSAAPDRPR